MPAGNWIVFNRAKLKLANGTFDLDTQTFKMALTTSSQALDATFVGGSTDCRYSDLTAEVVGTGYTAGGKTLIATWTQSTGTITFDVDDQAWGPSSTITAKYAVIYADNTNDDLLCVVDLDTGGGSVSTTAGTLTITINASGVFTLA
jgi:hypothetical protein